jgi:serine O-acetyltransferase
LAAPLDQPHTANGGRRDVFELTAPRLSFFELVWSDYEVGLVERTESRRLSKLFYLPRLLLNPSLQLALTVRMAQKGPRPLLNLIRWVQVTFFSSEIHRFPFEDGIELGPGVAFPHPIGIIIGGSTRIGAGVTIYNNTNIGGNRHAPSSSAVPAETACRLGDRSVIYAYSAVQGPYDVCNDAVVGIHVVLDGHVPPGALRSYRSLRLAGEWPGEDRVHWRPPGIEPALVEARA